MVLANSAIERDHREWSRTPDRRADHFRLAPDRPVALLPRAEIDTLPFGRVLKRCIILGRELEENILSLPIQLRKSIDLAGWVRVSIVPAEQVEPHVNHLR